MKTTIIPNIQLAADKAEIEQMPFIQAIKDKDPATYKDFMDLIERSHKDGLSSDEVIAKGRAKFQTLFDQSIGTSSDKALHNFIDALLPTLSELNAQPNDICFKFLFPKPTDGDTTGKYLAKSTEDKVIAAMTDVILTSGSVRPTLSLDDMQDDLIKIFTKLNRKYGDAVTALDNPHGTNVDKKAVCNLTYDMYQEVMALGRPKSTNMLRAMFSNL